MNRPAVAWLLLHAFAFLVGYVVGYVIGAW